MTISKLILRPHIERLKASFQAIEKGLVSDSYEQAELASRIRKQVSKLDALLSSVAAISDKGEVVPADWFETYKKAKLELRFTQRKWKRFVSNEIRFQKNPKGISYVPSFTA